MNKNFTGTDVGFGEVVCVAYDYTTGDFKASMSGSAYKVGSETAAPFFMAIFAVLMDDSVFAKQFDEFCKADENTQEGVDMLRSCACFLSDYPKESREHHRRRLLHLA